MTLKIDSSARLIGKIKAGHNSYFAQGTIIRSIGEAVTIGGSSMILENSVLIGTPEHPVVVGQKTAFGHRCLVLGATIGDLCEIGNSSIFLPGCVVGKMCIFGEGTMIESNQVIPDGSVVVGRPGRIIRRLTEDDIAMITRMRGGDIQLNDNDEKITHEGYVEDKMGQLYPYRDKMPQVAETARIFDSAEITGDVIIGENTIIGSGVRIIGNSHGPVIIGNNVQILENTVLHLLPDNRLVIADDVTIGPGCMIHGTTIGKHCVIESGSIVCDYSALGDNVLVTAGTLVKQRSTFEDNQILEGFPAKSIGHNQAILSRPDWAFSD